MLIEADLSSDPQGLRDMLATTMAELAALRVVGKETQAQIDDLWAERAATRAKIVRLNAVNDHAEAELVRLHEIIAALRRHRFGARSEKLDDEQLEMAFEDTETALGVVAASLDAVAAVPREPRRRKTNRGRLPAHLERVEQVVDIENKTCGCCGGALHVIGEDVAERLDVVPATFRVLVTRRPRYGCRGCEAAPVQAPAPAHLITGGLPSEALVAQVLVSKYADHLPLYRQAQIYARQGVELDRSTLADWTGRAAWWLRPLRDHLLGMLKRSGKLFADETVAPVLDPGRGRTRRGQLWAYARDDRPWGGSDPPTVAYRYAHDRAAEQHVEHLAGFRGVLQSLPRRRPGWMATRDTASSRAQATCNSPSAGRMCVTASSNRPQAGRSQLPPTCSRTSRGSMLWRPRSAGSRPMPAATPGRNAADRSSTTCAVSSTCGLVRSAAKAVSPRPSAMR